MNLNESLVFELLTHDNDFPISLENVADWLGYARKDYAKNVLVSNFVKDVDYTIEFSGENRKTPQGGRPREIIFLTIDCFKSFCMMAGTEKGSEVRLYFLACEKRLKAILSESLNQRVTDKLLSSIVSEQIVSSKPKFEDWFYDMLYRKRGQGWENRSTKNRPPCVGTWTNNIVYDQMLGGTSKQSVKSRLLSAEPKVNGTRKHPLHSHFSDGFGENYLKEHFKFLQLIDRITPDGDWDRFLYNINKAFPVEGKQIQLNLLYELEKFQGF